jgi:hypothetical protein
MARSPARKNKSPQKQKRRSNSKSPQKKKRSRSSSPIRTKGKLKQDEFLCFGCSTVGNKPVIRKGENITVQTVTQPNTGRRYGSMRGTCSKCGKGVYKVVSLAKVPELKKIYG